MDEPLPPRRPLPPGRPDFLPPAVPGPPPWKGVWSPQLPEPAERRSRTWIAVLAVTVVLAVVAAGITAAFLAVTGRPDTSTALALPSPAAPAFRLPLPSPSTGATSTPTPTPTTASPVPRPVFTPPADQAPLPDGRPSVAAGATVGAIARVTLPGVVQLVSTARAATGDSTTAGAATGDSSGSGFVVRDSGGGSGLVLTNNHVVADAVAGRADLTVVFADGVRTPARVVGTSPSYDTAVVEVSGARDLRSVPLGRSAPVAVGDPVVAIGAPLGLTGTVTSGIISAVDRPVALGGDQAGADQAGSEQTYVSALQTDAAINPGNSGGPLVDARGRVVGMNTAIASLGSAVGGQSGSIGLGFSIPIDEVRLIADQILVSGQARYPVIGAEVSTDAGGGPGDGAVIRTVTDGGPADDAGLVAGDVVVTVDGRRVGDGQELIVAIRRRAPGNTVVLGVRRRGSTSPVAVVLAGRPG